MKQAEIVYGSIPDDEQQVEFLTRIPGRAVDRAKALQSFIQETHRDLFDT